jgi:ankyrin repeat protein
VKGTHGLSKETVLHMAAAGGDAELVELLLNSGANVSFYLIESVGWLKKTFYQGNSRGKSDLSLYSGLFFGILCRYKAFSI